MRKTHEAKTMYYYEKQYVVNERGIPQVVMILHETTKTETEVALIEKRKAKHD